jgi:hypothetical protein
MHHNVHVAHTRRSEAIGEPIGKEPLQICRGIRPASSPYSVGLGGDPRHFEEGMSQLAKRPTHDRTSGRTRRRAMRSCRALNSSRQVMSCSCPGGHKRILGVLLP